MGIGKGKQSSYKCQVSICQMTRYEFGFRKIVCPLYHRTSQNKDRMGECIGNLLNPFDLIYSSNAPFQIAKKRGESLPFQKNCRKLAKKQNWERNHHPPTHKHQQVSLPRSQALMAAFNITTFTAPDPRAQKNWVMWSSWSLWPIGMFPPPRMLARHYQNAETF